MTTRLRGTLYLMRYQWNAARVEKAYAAYVEKFGAPRSFDAWLVERGIVYKKANTRGHN